MSDTKLKIQSLRTKVKGVIPNVFDFAKIILVAILSGVVWVLHFIGMVVEICLDLLMQLKQQLGAKKDSNVIDNSALDITMQEQINDKEKN